MVGSAIGGAAGSNGTIGGEAIGGSLLVYNDGGTLSFAGAGPLSMISTAVGGLGAAGERRSGGSVTVNVLGNGATTSPRRWRSSLARPGHKRLARWRWRCCGRRRQRADLGRRGFGADAGRRDHFRCDRTGGNASAANGGDGAAAASAFSPRPACCAKRASTSSSTSAGSVATGSNGGFGDAGSINRAPPAVPGWKPPATDVIGLGSGGTGSRVWRLWRWRFCTRIVGHRRHDDHRRVDQPRWPGDRRRRPGARCRSLWQWPDHPCGCRHTTITGNVDADIARGAAMATAVVTAMPVTFLSMRAMAGTCHTGRPCRSGADPRRCCGFGRRR